MMVMMIIQISLRIAQLSRPDVSEEFWNGQFLWNWSRAGIFSYDSPNYHLILDFPRLYHSTHFLPRIFIHEARRIRNIPILHYYNIFLVYI